MGHSFRCALALTLSLAACASDPAPTDASADGATDVPRGPDVADVTAPLDAPDAGHEDEGAIDVPTADEGSVEDVADVHAPSDVGPDVPAGFLACAVDGGVNVVDPQRDPQHCGACGTRCCGGWCINGRCGTEGPPGTIGCPLTPAEEAARGCTGPVPVNGGFDPANCGGCGVRCASDEVCASGSCVRVDAGAVTDAFDAATEDRPDA